MLDHGLYRQQFHFIETTATRAREFIQSNYHLASWVNFLAASSSFAVADDCTPFTLFLL